MPRALTRKVSASSLHHSHAQRGRMVAPSSDVRGDSTWAVDRSDGDEVLRVFGEGLELVYDSPDLVDQHDRRWERIELRDTGECN